MAKVLFTHSYFLRFDPKMWKHMAPYAPLGTIYAAAVLREHGHEVDLHDVMFAHGPDEILPKLDSFRPDYLVIYDDGFNYLTKMCLTNMRHAAWEMAQMAKARGIRSMVCSSDSTDHVESYLANGLDFVIKGEGEITLLELINGLEKGETQFGTMPGLAFQGPEGLEINPRRPVLRDLDTLPLPAWDLVEVAPYKEHWMAKWGFFTMNVATTRGCPYKCNWCAKPIYGNRYNSHSPERIAELMQDMIRKYGPTHFWMCDDIFGLKPGWVQTFADEVEKRGLKFKFKIQSRADLLLQDDNIAALARSGCDEVWIGAESGSQKILDAMDKGTTVEQIYQARKLLKKHHIRTAFFLQFGYPGEKREDIRATEKMLLDLMPDDIGISVSYPLPGTGFYERVKNELKEKSNWTDSDDLSLMFRNTYPPDFYRRLHRYVHKIYRRKQGFQNLGTFFNRPGLGKLRSVMALGYYIPAALLDKMRLSRLAKA
ncbi:MAG: B12-binding domain-containing radical SAM protein [Bacteroidia bacterium]|nr:B12-binding domain-containing radical SAM protein [Bacteroidia bacterium]